MQAVNKLRIDVDSRERSREQFQAAVCRKDMSDLRKWHELEAPSAVNVGTPLSLDGENNGTS